MAILKHIPQNNDFRINSLKALGCLIFPGYL